MIRRAASSVGLLALIATAGQLGYAVPAQAHGRSEEGAYSASDIVQLMRRNRLKPFASPRRHGSTYEAEGIDAQGEPTHVVIDAVTGDLLWRTHQGVTLPDARLNAQEQRPTRHAHRPPPHRPVSMLLSKAIDARTRPRLAHQTETPVAVRLPSVNGAPSEAASPVSQRRPMLISDPLALPGRRTGAAHVSEPGRDATAAQAVPQDRRSKQELQIPVAPLE